MYAWMMKRRKRTEVSLEFSEGELERVARVLVLGNRRKYGEMSDWEVLQYFEMRARRLDDEVKMNRRRDAVRRSTMLGPNDYGIVVY
jgi:hypothetical protein